MAKQVPAVEPEYIRPGAWQALTGMSVGSTYRALQSGQLKAFRVNRTWHIPKSELQSYFERNDNSAVQAA